MGILSQPQLIIGLIVYLFVAKKFRASAIVIKIIKLAIVGYLIFSLLF